jgi:diguanylate cyclase
MWLGRRSTRNPKVLGDYRLLTFLRGFSRLTRGFAADVSHYRQVVDEVSEQFNSVPAGELTANHDSVMSMMQQLASANEELQNRIGKAESTLQVQSEEIAGYMSEARTDKLTSLPNRRVMDDELARRLAEWNRYQTPLAIMILDIDFFKKFNDEHGHLAGDAVLYQVASIIRETVRESDLPVRMGGEEFAVILPSINGEQAWQAAERTRRAVENETFRYEGTELAVTISCGAAQGIENDTSTAIIKRADEALYSAKRSGRNQAHWHDGQMIRSPGSAPVVRTADDSANQDSDFGQVCLELRERLLAVVNDD